MLEAVSSEATARLIDVRLYLSLLRSIARTTRSPSVKPSFSAAKGLFFVYLYGVYEYVLTAALREVLRSINSEGIRVLDCQPVLLSMALDAECESLSFSGRNTAWERRRILFQRVRSAEPVVINESLIPTDGRNLQVLQLQSIWDTLAIKDPVLPDMRLRGRLEEVVQKRNAIAHGREAPSYVGGRFTLQELQARYRSMDRICSHLIATFQKYLEEKQYLA
jgi:hypothetical protein